MDDIRKISKARKKDNNFEVESLSEVPTEMERDETDEIIDILMEKEIPQKKVEKKSADFFTATQFVKVPFGKFVQLVATHDFEKVSEKHGNEEIVMSTVLLTELANAHEEVEENSSKVPLFFVVGLGIGIVITYLLIKF